MRNDESYEAQIIRFLPFSLAILIKESTLFQTLSLEMDFRSEAIVIPPTEAVQFGRIVPIAIVEPLTNDRILSATTFPPIA